MLNNSASKIEHKKFAFVIPTFNQADYLTRALKSVLKQKGNDYQIIVVNDGSTDNSDEILNNFSQIPHLHLYSQSNAGPNVACAEAIRRSNADYIIFMATDDALRPNYLENIRAILSKAPNIDMIFGNYCSISEEKNIKISQHTFPLNSPIESFKKYIEGELAMSTCGTLVKRNIMDTYINYPRPYPANYDTVIMAHCLLMYDCYQSSDVFVDVYAHKNRFRDSYYPETNGKNIVEIMFDQQIIGTDVNVQSLKNRFLAKSHRTNARSSYRAKKWTEACKSYALAFKIQPLAILNINTCKRFLICFVRMVISNVFNAR